MKERSLIERLRNPEAEAGLRAADDPALVEQSILRHLERVLNSRQQHALTVRDYGLPDLTGVGGSASWPVAEVGRAIRDCLERYEPRLQNVRVEFVESETEFLKLRFKITGNLASVNGWGVRFTTTIEPDGVARVAG